MYLQYRLHFLRLLGVATTYFGNMTAVSSHGDPYPLSSQARMLSLSTVMLHGGRQCQEVMTAPVPRRLHKLQQKHAQRQRLAQRAQAAAEDEIAWDDDTPRASRAASPQQPVKTEQLPADKVRQPLWRKLYSCRASEKTQMPRRCFIDLESH